MSTTIFNPVAFNNTDDRTVLDNSDNVGLCMRKGDKVEWIGDWKEDDLPRPNMTGTREMRGMTMMASEALFKQRCSHSIANSILRLDMNNMTTIKREEIGRQTHMFDVDECHTTIAISSEYRQDWSISICKSKSLYFDTILSRADGAGNVICYHQKTCPGVPLKHTGDITENSTTMFHGLMTNPVSPQRTGDNNKKVRVVLSCQAYAKLTFGEMPFASPVAVISVPKSDRNNNSPMSGCVPAENEAKVIPISFNLQDNSDATLLHIAYGEIDTENKTISWFFPDFPFKDKEKVNVGNNCSEFPGFLQMVDWGKKEAAGTTRAKKSTTKKRGFTAVEVASTSLSMTRKCSGDTLTPTKVRKIKDKCAIVQASMLDLSIYSIYRTKIFEPLFNSSALQQRLGSSSGFDEETFIYHWCLDRQKMGDLWQSINESTSPQKLWWAQQEKANVHLDDIHKGVEYCFPIQTFSTLKGNTHLLQGGRPSGPGFDRILDKKSGVLVVMSDQKPVVDTEPVPMRLNGAFLVIPRTYTRNPIETKQQYQSALLQNINTEAVTCVAGPFANTLVFDKEYGEILFLDGGGSIKETGERYKLGQALCFEDVEHLSSVPGNIPVRVTAESMKPPHPINVYDSRSGEFLFTVNYRTGVAEEPTLEFRDMIKKLVLVHRRRFTKPHKQKGCAEVEQIAAMMSRNDVDETLRLLIELQGEKEKGKRVYEKRDILKNSKQMITDATKRSTIEQILNNCYDQVPENQSLSREDIFRRVSQRPLPGVQYIDVVEFVSFLKAALKKLERNAYENLYTAFASTTRGRDAYSCRSRDLKRQKYREDTKIAVAKNNERTGEDVLDSMIAAKGASWEDIPHSTPLELDYIHVNATYICLHPCTMYRYVSSYSEKNDDHGMNNTSTSWRMSIRAPQPISGDGNSLAMDASSTDGMVILTCHDGFGLRNESILASDLVARVELTQSFNCNLASCMCGYGEDEGAGNVNNELLSTMPPFKEKAPNLLTLFNSSLRLNIQPPLYALREFNTLDDYKNYNFKQSPCDDAGGFHDASLRMSLRAAAYHLLSERQREVLSIDSRGSAALGGGLVSMLLDSLSALPVNPDVSLIENGKPSTMCLYARALIFNIFNLMMSGTVNVLDEAPLLLFGHDCGINAHVMTNAVKLASNLWKGAIEGWERAVFNIVAAADKYVSSAMERIVDKVVDNGKISGVDDINPGFGKNAKYRWSTFTNVTPLNHAKCMVRAIDLPDFVKKHAMALINKAEARIPDDDENSEKTDCEEAPSEFDETSDMTEQEDGQTDEEKMDTGCNVDAETENDQEQENEEVEAPSDAEAEENEEEECDGENSNPENDNRVDETVNLLLEKKKSDWCSGLISTRIPTSETIDVLYKTLQQAVNLFQNDESWEPVVVHLRMWMKDQQKNLSLLDKKNASDTKRDELKAFLDDHHLLVKNQMPLLQKEVAKAVKQTRKAFQRCLQQKEKRRGPPTAVGVTPVESDDSTLVKLQRALTGWSPILCRSLNELNEFVGNFEVRSNTAAVSRPHRNSNRWGDDDVDDMCEDAVEEIQTTLGQACRVSRKKKRAITQPLKVAMGLANILSMNEESLSLPESELEIKIAEKWNSLGQDEVAISTRNNIATSLVRLRKATMAYIIAHSFPFMGLVEAVANTTSNSEAGKKARDNIRSAFDSFEFSSHRFLPKKRFDAMDHTNSTILARGILREWQQNIDNNQRGELGLNFRVFTEAFKQKQKKFATNVKITEAVKACNKEKKLKACLIRCFQLRQVLHEDKQMKTLFGSVPETKVNGNNVGLLNEIYRNKDEAFFGNKDCFTIVESHIISQVTKYVVDKLYK